MMAATDISEAAYVIKGAKCSMEIVWMPFDTETLEILFWSYFTWAQTWPEWDYSQVWASAKPNKRKNLFIICTHTLGTFILASKKFHTFWFTRLISYFNVSYLGFSPL